MRGVQEKKSSQIDGHTRTCGLFGNPVEHTLSPVIHNTLAAALGHNLVYVPFKVEETDVKAAVEAVKALNLLGVNVTVPHKSAVMEYLDEVDDLAAKIGAVNTIVPTEGGLKGYNTDMPGLYRAMQSEGIEVKDASVVILGAGGAARAVAMLCAANHAKEVYILNRSYEKALAVANEVNEQFEQDIMIPMDIKNYRELPKKSYIAIQATSVGLYPNCNDVVIEDEAFYQMMDIGVDLIYNPEKTRFMQLIEEQGKKAMNGLKMLLYQGIIAYELWNDCQVTDELAEEVLKKMREELEK